MRKLVIGVLLALVLSSSAQAGDERLYLVKDGRAVSVPKNIEKTMVPAFAYSEGRATYSPGFLVTGGDTPASIINNFRVAAGVIAGGHTYYHAVPADRYFKDHPEYFAQVGD